MLNTVGKFGALLIIRVSPYDENSEKVVQELFVIAQKMCLDALNATQKVPVLFLKKTRIT